jgi:signal transduction histidine kinase
MHDEPTPKDITLVLAEIAGAVVGQFDVKMLLDKIILLTMNTLHAEVASIFLEDKEKEPGIIECVAGSGFAEKIIRVAKYKRGECLTGTVFECGVGYNSKNPEEHEKLKIEGKNAWEGKFDNIQWPSGKSQFRNGIGLPLKIKDQILGVIKVENKIEEFGDFFSEEDEIIFKTIANVVALTIENARLHDKIEKQLKTISAKAAHRINNQAANYDGIELDLALELKSPGYNKDNLSEIHGRLVTTTKNLKNMINEFRNFGKPLKLQKNKGAINKIIQAEVKLAQESWITIQDSYDKSIPDFQIDEARFAESMKELLSNAKKALRTKKSQDGIINVSTALIRDKGNEHVVIRIEDNGPGFLPSFPLFEPFNSTDPQSTGLGLSTVKELIEKHGGGITTGKSSLGGACIVCTMPLTNHT